MIYGIFHTVCDHLINGTAHVLSIQDTTTLAVDNLSLIIHNLIVLQQVFTNTKVVTLDLLLCFLNCTGKHLMLNLLTIRNTHCVEHIDQFFRTEQTHQIIFQRNIETGFTRISLSTGTSTQLIINTTGFMTLGTNDFQTTGSFCLIIQFDIGTTACHVSCDRYCTMYTGLRYDFSLKFMEFRI